MNHKETRQGVLASQHAARLADHKPGANGRIVHTTGRKPAWSASRSFRSSHMSQQMVVLLGAGASAPLGYPTIADISVSKAIHDLPSTALTAPLPVDFAHLARNIDVFIRMTRKRPSFEAAIDRTRRYYELLGEISRDPNLSEVFLTHVITAREAGHLQRVALDLYQLLHQALLHVYGNNQINTPGRRAAATSLANLFDFIRKATPSKSLSIYTTNYDVALDEVSRQNLNSFDFKDHNTQTADQTKVTPTAFCLLRLHGCVRYFRSSSRGKTESEIRFLNSDEVDWATLRYRCLSAGQSLAQAMAIKVGEGELDFQHAPFKHPFEMFYKQLHQELRACVVGGYSFDDRSVSRIIYDALDAGTLSVLLCIDPYLRSEVIVERLCATAEHPIPVEKVKTRIGQRVVVLPYSIDDPEVLTNLKASSPK